MACIAGLCLQKKGAENGCISLVQATKNNNYTGMEGESRSARGGQQITMTENRVARKMILSSSPCLAAAPLPVAKGFGGLPYRAKEQTIEVPIQPRPVRHRICDAIPVVRRSPSGTPPACPTSIVSRRHRGRDALRSATRKFALLASVRFVSCISASLDSAVMNTWDKANKTARVVRE
jgi:hypothetical protein